MRILTGLFHHPEPAGASVLSGRASVVPAQLDGIGSVIVKHYRRGGLLRHFIKCHYLKIGKTRAAREFELLDLAINLGINVPQPVAFAYRGHLLYQAWLVTREIHQALSLARLSLQDEKKAGAAMESVIEQISSLIRHHILHPDLHPGNAVIDDAGKVYLLDFDKGSVIHGNRKKLKNRYLARWQQAVDKHRLPTVLNEMMQKGLES